MNTMIMILILTEMIVRAYEMRSMPFYNLRQFGFTRIVPVANLAIQLRPPVLQKQCYVNKVLIECPVYPVDFSSNMITNIDRNFQRVAHEQQHQDSSNSSFERTAQSSSNSNQPPPSRKMIHEKPAPNLNMLSSHGNSDGHALPLLSASASASTSNKLNMKLDTSYIKRSKSVLETTESLNDDLLSITFPTQEDLQQFKVNTAWTDFSSSVVQKLFHDVPIVEKFAQSLDYFERKFYTTTFKKLTSISPASRRENGMSYVQSGLFLQLALMALSTEVGPEARREIDECLGLHISDEERIQLINSTVSSLPVSSEDLKFRWSSRLVLQSQNISDQFRTNTAPALKLQIDRFNGTETPREIALALNHMVEIDSGGAIHDTFEEDDLSKGVCAVLITTLYLRARWRSAPTLLNGTRPFHDSESASNRTVRMIRVNDVMRYAELTEWDAEAVEIFYSTPGLSLLMLVPRGKSLSRLVDQAVNTSLATITERMQPHRVAATLPLYTLRMTLLLPNKLEAMNISRLLEINNRSQSESFRLSHAVQRIMFWAEAGRNAFKDDGLNWDEPPQRELVVDRPYIFYVRWKNKTLMNGNFVL